MFLQYFFNLSFIHKRIFFIPSVFIASKLIFPENNTSIRILNRSFEETCKNILIISFQAKKLL